LEPSRMASERLAALHRHLAEETARLLGWEAGQEVAARDREARILYLEQQASLQASNAALRAELADAGQWREEVGFIRGRVALIRMEIFVLEVKERFEEEMRIGEEMRPAHWRGDAPSEIAVLEAQFMAVCGVAARLVGGGKTLHPRMASQRLDALHRQLAEETGRLLCWEARQEVAARDREARILHLEQLAADGGRQEASLQASNAALRAELAEAGQRREELELRVAHIRREIAVLEAQLTAVCGEAARLVGGGKTPASQAECLEVEELTRGVHRLGLAHQEEVAARREQEQKLVGEAATETAALADTRGLLQQRLIGARWQVDASKVKLEEVKEEVKVNKKAVKEQNGHEVSWKIEEAKNKKEQEKLMMAIKKNKKTNDELVKEKNKEVEIKRKLEKEEKLVANLKEKLKKFFEVEQKLVKEEEVRDDEVADLASTAQAQGRLVAAAARRVEDREQELATLRPAAAALETARQQLAGTETARRLAESEAGAMEGIRGLREQLAGENQAFAIEIKVCEDKLEVMKQERITKKEEVAMLERKARERREEWRSSEELSKQQKVELGRLSEAVQQVKLSIKAKEEDISASTYDLSDQGEEKEAKMEHLGKITEEKEELKKKLDALDEEFNEATMNLGKMKTKKSDLEKILKELSGAEGVAGMSEMDLKKTEAEVNRKVREEEGKLKEMKNNEEKLVQDVQTLVATTEEIAKELAQMEVEKMSQIKSNRALAEEVENSKDELAGVKSRVKILRKQVDAVPTVGEAGDVEAAATQMATELERTKAELVQKAREEDSMVTNAEELREATKASKEKQADVNKLLKIAKAQFKSGKKMETDSTSALQFKAKELEKLEAKLARDAAEVAELATKKKLWTENLTKWQERKAASKEEQKVAAERFSVELHRMAEDVIKKVQEATEQKLELKKEVQENKRQLALTDSETEMEQGNTSRSTIKVASSAQRSPRTLSGALASISRSPLNPARLASGLSSLRRGPAAPSVSSRPGVAGSANSTISASSSRLGAASSSATGRTVPLGATPGAAGPALLPTPTTKSGRRMFGGSLTPRRRPADQVEKRKGEVDASGGIFDVSSSDASPSKMVALSPQRAARLGAATPVTSRLGPVTPGTPGRPQLADSRARSRLYLGRGQPRTPKTPPAQVIGVSDSCFDSSY